MDITRLGTMRAAIEGDVKDLAKGFDLARKDTKGFGKDFPGWVKPVGVAMVGIGTATVAGMGFAVKGFGDFEQAMKNVQAVSGATSEEYKQLKNFAIDMGSSTEFSARQAGEGMYYLASAGMNVADQMKTTSAVLDLASATQSDLASSSEIVVNTLSGFDLQAEQSRRVADIFAQSISSSQANMEKLGVSIPIVAATANDFEYSLEGTVAALSLLYDKGIRGQKAATGLRNALKTLLDVTPEGAAALDDLGLTVSDLDPRMNDLVSIVQKLEDANFDTAASVQIFGKENDAMSLLVSTGADKLREFEASLKVAGGAAKDMADVQLDSLNGSIKLLLSALDGAKLSLGEVWAPAVKSSAEGLTGLITRFNELSDTEKQIVGWTIAVGAGLSGVTGAGMLLLGKLPQIAKGFALVKTTLTGMPKLATGLSLSFGAVGLAAAAGLAYVAIKNWNEEARKFEDEQETLKGRVNDVTKEFLQQTEAIKGGYTDLGLFTHRTISNTEALRANILVQRDQNEAREDIEEATGVALASEEELMQAQIKGATNAEELMAAYTRLELSRVKSSEKSAEVAIFTLAGIEAAEKAYFSLAGDGWDTTEMQARDFWETYREQGNLSLEAERYVAKALLALREKGFEGASFLAETYTNFVGKEHGKELDKRSVLDEEFLGKIQRNALRKLGIASDELQKESGLIKDFFDWEVILAAERSIKLQRKRARQYAEESRLHDQFLMDMVAGEERMLEVTERVVAKDLEILNRGHEAGIRMAEEEERERKEFFDFFLADATSQVEKQIDLQKDFQDKTQEQVKQSFNQGVATIDATYQKFKTSFTAVGADLLKLDMWRAERMLEIEKALSKAKVKELDNYYDIYENRVKSHQEAFGTAGGLFGGVSAYGDMDVEYKELLTGALPDAIYSLTDALQTTITPPDLPLPTRGVGVGGGTIGRTGGGDEYHFHIENLYGADEAFLNTFAEDIARRIQGQNIQI